MKGAVLRLSALRSAPGGLRVLTYHGMPTDFARHIEAVRSVATIIDEDRFCAYVDGAMRWPEESPEVLITFDDGYRSIVERGGLDVAAEHGVKPVVFALASVVDAAFGQPRGLMKDPDGSPLPLCDVAELRALGDAGWTIGCHTATHWDCGDPDIGRLDVEIRQARAALAEALAAEIRLFAFPWGKPRHAPETAQAVVAASGYTAGFSTVRGRICAGAGTARTFFRRDTIDEWWSSQHVLGCLGGGLDRIDAWRSEG